MITDSGIHEVMAILARRSVYLELRIQDRGSFILAGLFSRLNGTCIAEGQGPTLQEAAERLAQTYEAQCDAAAALHEAERLVDFVEAYGCKPEDYDWSE